MDFPNRLKMLRINKKLTQKSLSSAIGVSVVTLYNWENGIKSPTKKSIINLSNALGVSVDELLGHRQCEKFSLTSHERDLIEKFRKLDKISQGIMISICDMELARKQQKQPPLTNIIPFDKKGVETERYIPFYSTPSAAGYSSPIDCDEFDMILVDSSVPRDADYSIRIQGNSMMPYVTDGEIVYVKKTDTLEVGDVGIFCVDGAMYCKQYCIHTNGDIELVSTNEDLMDTNVLIKADGTSSVKICGKALLDRVPRRIPKYVKM